MNNQTGNLDQLFEKIDNELILKKIPVYQRYMATHFELEKYFPNVPMPIHPKGLLTNNDFGNALCIALYNWYENKYGDKCRTNLDLGFFFIIFNN